MEENNVRRDYEPGESPLPGMLLGVLGSALIIGSLVSIPMVVNWLVP